MSKSGARFATEGAPTVAAAPEAVAAPTPPPGTEAPPDAVAQKELAEVQARIATLQAEIATGTDPGRFDRLVPEMAQLMVRRVPLIRAVNQKALVEAQSKLGHLVEEAAKRLNLSGLLGQTLNRVSVEWVTREGQPPMLVVALNSGGAKAAPAPKTPGTKAPRTGEGRDLGTIFEQEASPEERAKMAELVATKALAVTQEEKVAAQKAFNSKAWSLKNSVAKRAAAK